MGPCSRSVHITFTVRVTKQHPVNISFLKTEMVMWSPSQTGGFPPTRRPPERKHRANEHY